MSKDDLQQTLSDDFFPKIRKQYPGLLDTLTNPRVVVVSRDIYDVEHAVTEVKREWAAEGATEDDFRDFVPMGEVLDDISGVQGIPLPTGTILLILDHGPEDGRKPLAVPVNVK